ncbi:YggS family pyridoxal phosphate-dependent enzyme [Anabaena sp. FACHB-1237]|nr:YggS family pyridoxal phosphate-dependent enzyme [Anabaena sp. FACHB-1237]MBD2138560.1 YggS family pyridoxal phosphate-dependent enzyme [Anabaena sp. FACHB-1237]
MSQQITQRIADISASLPNTVRLIAVSKTVPSEFIRTAYNAGIRDFAESRIQETISKQAELQDLTDITWHLIGHLQINKAKKALQIFQWIHSVDSLALAQRLNTLAFQIGVHPHICLQVKILPDDNKYGWIIPELLSDLSSLNECQYLKIQGLMTIPPLGLENSQILNVFNSTRELGATINSQNWSNISIEELSMGMSGDYLMAVAAGATMVRLGTTLFGQRS